MSPDARVRSLQRLTAAAGAVLLSAALVGCNEVRRQDVGMGAGAVVGAVLGSQIGSGTGRTIATVGGAALGAYIGREIGKYLDAQDRARHEQATARALDTGQSQSWANQETGASGRAEVVETTTRTRPASVPVLKDRVEEVPPLDLIGERYRASTSSNVRGGPGTDYRKVGALAEGEVVDVVGKVQGKDWLMISDGSAGSGFVYAPLLTPAPEAAPAEPRPAAAAGAEVERRTVESSTTCRTVQQTVTLSDGTEHQEEVTACRGPDGWEIV